MDYNDNDYEGQNLNLAGEESSKNSSALRPFALPKYDFDDGLHAHLKFDSLVENEVFLGIPSQDDNQWIEDYSRGSSGVEFSSSATEPCALPRCNNVWSEATSSESVEMLLKAVRQEEMVPGESMVEESDPGDQLGSLTGQIGSNLRHDDKTDSVGEVNALLLPSDMQIDNIESSSQNYIGESDDQDKVSRISFVSSSCISKGITDEVEEKHEGLNANNKVLSGNAVETVDSEMQCSLEIPPEMESFKEEFVVGKTTEFRATSSVLEKGESVSAVGECSEIAISVETVAVFSSSSGSLLHEMSPVSSQGEKCTEEFGVKGGEAVIPTLCDSEPTQVPVTQPLEQPMSPAGGADICPERKSSLEASHATFEDSTLTDAVSDFYGQDPKSNVDHADGTRNSMDSSFGGECGVEKLVSEMRDARSDVMSQKESLENSSTQTPVQEDVRAGDQDVSPCEEDSKNLPPGLNNIVCDDNEKEGRSNFAGEGGKIPAEKAAESQDNQGLNIEVEHTKVTSTRAEPDDLVDCHEHKSPFVNTGYMNQRKDLEAATEPKDSLEVAAEVAPSSVSKDSLEVAAEVAPSTEIEDSTLLPSVAAGGTAPISLVDKRNAAMHDEAGKELNELMENPVSDLIVQNDRSEASPTEKPMEAEVERTTVTNSSILSGSNSAVGSGESNQVFAPSLNNYSLQQGEINKKESLEGNTECIGDLQSKSIDPGVSALSEEERTFTFDIRPLEGQSTVESVKGLQSFPRIKACVLSSTEEAAPSIPCSTQKDTVIMNEKSHGSSLTSSGGGQPPEEGKAPSERKTGRGSSKGKGTAEKGNPSKEKTSSRRTGRGNKSSTSSSPLGTGQVMIFESAVRPRVLVSNATSSLPDLNTSAPSSPPLFLQPSTALQQPYTDSQQLQLRAQILVYGSLIQGIAPEESYMVAAFSMPDGGRSIWEASLRTCRERLRGQKNQGNTIETPLQSHSGAKTADQPSRKGSRSGAVGASNTPIPSPVINQIVPLSSPLWNMSTPSFDGPSSSSIARSSVFDYRDVSPLHPYQTPPLRNFMAPPTSWPSQAPFSVPWLASSLSSPLSVGVNYSAFPNTEPVKLTPVKESTLQISSGSKHASPVPAIHTGATTVFAGTAPHVHSKNTKVSSSQTPVDTKTRKRKKSSASEDVGRIPVTASLVDTVPACTVANNLTKKVPAVGFLGLIAQTQAASTSNTFVNFHNSTSVAVPTLPSFMPKGTPSQSCDRLQGGDLLLGNRALNLESIRKVDEAKLEAEEAAAHATLAVSQCEDVWSKLVRQDNSDSPSDTEAILASAAVAIAAAASVAKAAAAAAKVASSVAVQAKKMADEAVAKHGTSFLDSGNETPVSIFKSTAMSAAREAARKRVEAASAATRHAENLDAIVKAAELAAEAVSHTGKIVGMGDPFSLNELREAGPDGYWKTSYTNQNKSNLDNVREVPPVSMDLDEVPEKDVHAAGHGTPPIQNDVRTNIVEERSTGYKEGSVVEVLRDCGDLRKAWFSAKILSLKDGGALVCYTEIQSEGSDQLKEWVPLVAQGGKAPIMRFPYPMTLGTVDGTRKRSRAAAMDYAVGNRVDAFVKDCWREAIVVEKSKTDPTALTVSFPAEGETKVVKVWHIRPTFIWSDGQWTECCGSGENGASQGDTPVEKRLKLGSKGVESKGKGKTIDSFEEKRAEPSKLPLSAKDNVFSIGSTRDENPNMVRTKRSGLQKEGAKVVFGVPKPTRKFMDVSKHYVSEKSTKTTEPNDAAKLSNTLMQQGSSSRGLKNNSNPDFQEKQASESKGKAVRTPRPPIIPGGTSGPTMVFASQALRPDNKKKALTRTAGSERIHRSKGMPSGKLSKAAPMEKTIPEAAEPRRSIRRIQPTSRLLEGIQSSLIMPNSHVKSEKSIAKGSSSKGNDNRG